MRGFVAPHPQMVMVLALVVLCLKRIERLYIVRLIITTIVMLILLIYTNGLENVVRDDHDLKFSWHTTGYLHHCLSFEARIILGYIELQFNVIIHISRTTSTEFHKEKRT